MIVYELTNHAKEQIVDRKIDPNWISYVIENPDKIEIDSDDFSLYRVWRKIPEANNKVLKVVYNYKIIPYRIITVHFHEKYRGKL